MFFVFYSTSDLYSIDSFTSNYSFYVLNICLSYLFISLSGLLCSVLSLELVDNKHLLQLTIYISCIDMKLSYSFNLTLILNTSMSSAAYMRQWSRSSSMQIMACRMFGHRQFRPWARGVHHEHPPPPPPPPPTSLQNYVYLNPQSVHNKK